MMVKKAGPPRTKWGEPDKINASMLLNDSLGYKVSHEGGQQLCERCASRRAEVLVVGEREGKAVWICSDCRERSHFPLFLARRQRRDGL